LRVFFNYCNYLLHGIIMERCVRTWRCSCINRVPRWKNDTNDTTRTISIGRGYVEAKSAKTWRRYTRDVRETRQSMINRHPIILSARLGLRQSRTRDSRNDSNATSWLQHGASNISRPTTTTRMSTDATIAILEVPHWSGRRDWLHGNRIYSFSLSSLYIYLHTYIYISKV